MPPEPIRSSRRNRSITSSPVILRPSPRSTALLRAPQAPSVRSRRCVEVPSAAGFILSATEAVRPCPAGPGRGTSRRANLAFLDEDDAFEPDDRRSAQPAAAMVAAAVPAAALVALAIGVVIIILLVLGVRGCLNARKERGFENYVAGPDRDRDESQQLSAEFFKRLEDPATSPRSSFKAEIAADRSTAESLLQRVQGLDTPDELADEQRSSSWPIELRADGIGGTADQISTALGNRPAEAIEAIADYMRYFLASDVLYGRARDGDRRGARGRRDITPEKLPETPFLPEPRLARPLVPDDDAGGVSAGGQRMQGRLRAGAVRDADQRHEPDPRHHEHDQRRRARSSSRSRRRTRATATRPTSRQLHARGGAERSGRRHHRRDQAGRHRRHEDRDRARPRRPARTSRSRSTVGPVPGEEIADNNTSTYTVNFERLTGAIR